MPWSRLRLIALKTLIHQHTSRPPLLRDSSSASVVVVVAFSLFDSKNKLHVYGDRFSESDEADMKIVHLCHKGVRAHHCKGLAHRSRRLSQLTCLLQFQATHALIQVNPEFRYPSTWSRI